MGTASVRRNLQNSGNNPQPVISMDRAGNSVGVAPAGGVANASLGVGIVNITGTDGTGQYSVYAGNGNSDATGNSNIGLDVRARNYGYNGATWDRIRTPNVFKPFSVTVASIGTGQTVWAVASTNKRFRLMGFAVTSDKAVQVNFKDGSVATLFSTPAVVAATPFGVSGIGNGMLSASANNLLALDVSASVPVVLTGTVWGTEE